jgi:hypothetical protein
VSDDLEYQDQPAEPHTYLPPNPKLEQVDPDSIEALDFTVRTYNCLRREGITTIQSLAAVTESQLQEIRNFGERSVEEVKAKLSERGYRLRPEIGEAFSDRIEVEHVTVYRWGNLQVTVNETDGSALISQRELSAKELGALCRICEQIVTVADSHHARLAAWIETLAMNPDEVPGFIAWWKETHG